MSEVNQEGRYWLVPYKSSVNQLGPRSQYEFLHAVFWGGTEVGASDLAWEIISKTLDEGFVDKKANQHLKQILSTGRNFPILCNPIAPKPSGQGNVCEYGLGVDLIGLEGILAKSESWKTITEEQYRTQYFGK